MGLATAQAFAAAGAAVVLADVNEDPLRAAVNELTAAGHHALGVPCDVSDEDQVAAMVERAVATFCRLDMVYNNAGIQVPPSDAADEPAENFDRVNAVNLRQRRLPQRNLDADGHRHDRQRGTSIPTRGQMIRSAASDAPTRSPRPCSGCAAPARVSSSASRSPSTADTPPADAGAL
jgi:NAD(P)-dependent dehydrogenase (short-subunit alcohol dehydrogenase family)